MRLIQAFFVMIPLLVGCAGVSVQAAIKTPLDDKCGQAGLQGCPELGEGILLYIEGDEVKGKEMVLRAAGQNTPANVNVAGTRPNVKMNRSSSAGDIEICSRNTSTLTAMTATVTTGVVRDGMTSLRGIIGGFAGKIVA